jgi:outer membrane protein assembly factor BamD
MLRRTLVCLVLAALLVGAAACHSNKKVQNLIATIDSKQPDKVLFDRAMDAMKHNKFDVARLTLQTLINTYPDSEFLARAKLGVGDSWYAEGGTAALSQAENEYKDFITFFPNMPEAAEAQLKIANIHYNQMEKPDRDFTHAKRAEDEYRELIKNFPESKLVTEAKNRLREVQEVLAEREFRIGRFYYLRGGWPAAIARLKSLTDTYPLYSEADEALFMLGDAYQKEATIVNSPAVRPDGRAQLVKEFSDQAAQAFSRIITRYPATTRVDDARKRLEAMHRPVPTPTPEAIAQNKAEMASRSDLGMFSRTMLNLHRRPDVSHTARVGEPSLVDAQPTNAAEMVRHATDVMTGKATQNVSVETVGTGAPAANQPTPRSDNSNDTNDSGVPELKPIAPSGSDSAPAGGDSTQPAPAPPQVNEAAQTETQTSADSSSSASSNGQSSSKTKKKSGMRKLVPF